MKKLIKKSVITILCLLLSSLNSYTQISGYGTSYSVESDPNWSSGIHYLDEVRAEVTTISSSTSSSLCVDISTTYFKGTFTNNVDMALLIQMKGGTVGRHQNVWVVSGTCSPLANLKLTAVNGTMLSYSVGSGCNLQLIKIHRYDDFTLSRGIVTCSQYDGHTGGILPIIVDGLLDISGGLITVDSKGYSSTDTGCIFASGGNGASAAASPFPASSVSAPSSILFNGGGGCGFVPLAVTGSSGGQANNSGSSGSVNTGGTSFGGSNFNTQLVMGDPGFYLSGYGSGTGAGGGGFGGTGGNTICPNNGSGGISGSAGKSGGAAGKGGRGGSALLIKAINVSITSNSVVFSANGGNAFQGGNGGNGGEGGLGGPGGQGCCANLGMDAGSGGNGDRGAGGTGGDGGHVGNAGFIWIACNNNYTWTAINNFDNFSISGGAGANAGKGGWGGGNTTPSSIPGVNRCLGNECTSGGTSCIYVCDVDYSMCFLAANAKSADAAGSTDTRFYSGSACTGLIGRYFNATNLLEVYDGCDTYISNWSGSTKSPTDMFKHFRTCGGSGVPKIVGLIDYNTNAIATGCGSGGAIHIDFLNSSGDKILSYDHESPDAAAYIHEEETANKYLQRIVTM